MRNADRITRALALATAAFVSAPGAVRADSHNLDQKLESLDQNFESLLREIAAAEERDDPGGLRKLYEAYVGFSVSRGEVNSNFGIGTVDFGGGRELFGASVGNWINRGGFDVGLEIDTNRPGHLSDHFGAETDGKFRVGFSYSSGSGSNFGSETVGIGGVERVALTYLKDNDPGPGFDTGLFTAAPGDTLDAFAKIDNTWGLAHFGYGESFTPHGPDGPEVSVGGAFIFEWFDQEFSGRADIVRGGSSIAGQTTRGDTEDKYYGYEFNAGVTLPITGKFSAGVEAYITPSWHKGKASLFQFTDLSDVTQRLDFSDDGFVVTGGLRTNLKYDITPDVAVKVSYEYSQLGGVSEVHVPENPGEQPAFFANDPIERHFGRAEIQWKFSDSRLKRDIVPLARLDNGLKLYRYRYLWSDTVYVGVMAQEVALVIPEAVIRGSDGFLRVDYARLGLRLLTWEEWRAAQEEAFGVAAAKTGTIPRHLGAVAGM